jgi:hypothetical protein
LSTEDRVSQLESAFATLVQLTRSHGERFDTHMGWINQLGQAQAELTAAQANSEEKIAALVDAQIHTEAVAAATNERIDRLVELVARTDAKLNRLAELVERLAGS